MGDARRRRRAATTPAGRLALLLLAAFLMSISLAAQVARAPPPIPMTTQGVATDAAGTPLPAGTLIRTFLDGVDYSNDTKVLDAAGDFSVATAGNLVLNATTPEASPIKTGANLGEAVLYAAGPFALSVDYFQQAVAWYPDRTVAQDLRLGSAATTPAALRIQGIVTQPARGGPQYVFLCNPTGAGLSLADYYLQLDAPGSYYGGNFTLNGTIAGGSEARVNLTSPFSLIPTGDALKLVYRNPGGAAASAGGRDIVIDRLEYNATANGTLDWQPGNTILGNAPAPGPGQILERTSFCSAAPAPGAFRLAPEPGLPPTTAPSVTITAPTTGQNVQGGQAFTILWTMSDPVFIPDYLRVWVNVTYQGTTRTLLDGTAGATSAAWDVPDVDAPGASVHVSAVNPFGAGANATTSFHIVPSTPYSAYIAILVIVVIAVFILIAYYYVHRTSGPPPGTPPAAGPPAAPPPVEAAQAPPGTQGPGTKVCPTCGTTVRESDGSCFYCGHPFAPPPP